MRLSSTGTHAAGAALLMFDEAETTRRKSPAQDVIETRHRTELHPPHAVWIEAKAASKRSSPISRRLTRAGRQPHAAYEGTSFLAESSRM